MTTRVFRGITYTVQTATGDGQTLQGAKGNDWIEALGGNNKISTGQGNDVILAGVTFASIVDDQLYGGQTIIYNPLPATSVVGNNIVEAGSGDDYVVTGAGNDIVDLGNGNNVLDGTAGGNDRISAGNGNDIIDISGIGNHQVEAGGGNNWIYLAAGKALVSAGSGNDVITTNSASGLSSLLTYVLDLAGQPYKQAIDAGAGNNQIELPVFGQTSVTTGSGQDFVLAASVSTQFGGAVNSDSVDILTGSGSDTVITIGTKSLVKTGAGDDLIVAGAGDDTIYAGSGRNVINLRGGDFSIPSPLDNLGLFGANVTVQGGGNDTVYLESGHDTVILGSGGFATIYGFSRNDLLNVNGLNATFTRSGNNTLISSGSTPVGVLKGYTGSVSLA